MTPGGEKVDTMLVRTTPFTLFESFDLDSKKVVRRRSLRYDMNALADFEQEVGMGFAQLMNSKAIFATTRAMLWAGLKHADRGLTLEATGNLIMQYCQQGGDIGDVLGKCFEAAQEQGVLGTPKAEVSEEPPPNAPQGEGQ